MEEKLTCLQEKLAADQNLAERIFAVETPEEVQSLLEEQGLEFTLPEINMLRDTLVKSLARGEGDELSDEDLEEVAGGIAITTTIGIIAGIVSATCGAGTFTHNTTRGRW
ncbi:MAG: Nif11-like leader peptide family RiPP precursor [Peptococcaceae bacterium]